MSLTNCIVTLVLASSGVFLTGCGKSAADSDQGGWPGAKPLTWREYVDVETPRREASTRQRYYREAMPNMSRWEPADFLPEKYLNSQHIGVCELSADDRAELRNALGASNQPSAWPTIEKFAERGVVRAQISFGSLCDGSDAEKFGVSGEEALEWSRKAAGSGRVGAMFNLGQCIERRIQATDERYTHNFLADEAIYWYWRAAQGLRSLALNALARFPGQEYYDYGYAEPGEIDENDVQTYRWYFLSELTAALVSTREGLLRLGVGVDDFATNARMSQEELQRAQRLAREWLLTYPDALPGYVERTDRRDCKLDHALNGKPLNFESLNHQLERLGLHYDPENEELIDLSNS